jgi:hypothetical protein
MITKELFKETIEEIYKFHQKLDKLDKIGFNCIADELVNISYEDQLIKLLSSEFVNKDEAYAAICWWIYDREFGYLKPEIIINKGKKNEHVIYIDESTTLYDYLKGDC